MQGSKKHSPERVVLLQVCLFLISTFFYLYILYAKNWDCFICFQFLICYTIFGIECCLMKEQIFFNVTLVCLQVIWSNLQILQWVKELLIYHYETTGFISQLVNLINLLSSFCSALCNSFGYGRIINTQSRMYMEVIVG